MDKGVERGSMFAKFLTLIKSEQGDIPALSLGNLTGDNGTGLVFCQARYVQDF
jgi:hypothetical protein